MLKIQEEGKQIVAELQLREIDSSSVCQAVGERRQTHALEYGLILILTQVLPSPFYSQENKAHVMFLDCFLDQFERSLPISQAEGG